MTMRNAREVAAFTDFATASHGALLRTAYLVIRDHQLAQDLVQEALTKTYVAWPRIRDHAKAESYARRSIVTTAIGWRRRRSFHERPAETASETTPRPDPTDAIAVREAVWEQLASLPPRQRAALVLRYYEDLSEASTAELMGCSVGTVKSQVSAGLARLRARVGTDVLALTDERTVVP